MQAIKLTQHGVCPEKASLISHKFADVPIPFLLSVSWIIPQDDIKASKHAYPRKQSASCSHCFRNCWRMEPWMLGICMALRVSSKSCGRLYSAAITTCRHMVRSSDVWTSRVSRCRASSTKDGNTCSDRQYCTAHQTFYVLQDGNTFKQTILYNTSLYTSKDGNTCSNRQYCTTHQTLYTLKNDNTCSNS